MYITREIIEIFNAYTVKQGLRTPRNIAPFFIEILTSAVFPCIIQALYFRKK